VILQLLLTYAPLFQAMFGNEAIQLLVWPRLLAGGLLFFAVVEAERFVIRSSSALRKTVRIAHTTFLRTRTRLTDMRNRERDKSGET
jgi:hypothetical protein